MSQTHFTPGPWFQSHRKQDDEDGGYMTQVYDADGETIANLAWHPVETPSGLRTDREENAHLISAAPELYAALDNILHQLSISDDEGLFEHADVVASARAVLAKARGES